jgi:carboxymethylenebutenolidase
LSSSERLALPTSDGGLTPACLARSLPIGPVDRADGRTDRPGMVILPDRRGLHPYYERLAECFADAGIPAVAVDFYHRTAGTSFRGDGFDAMPHRELLTDEHVHLDAAAGAAALRELGVERVYVVGFCLGGRGALLEATDASWSGVVSFYGFPTRESADGRSAVRDAQDGKVSTRVLALFGAEDEGVGRDAPDVYGSALRAAGVDHEIVAYPGAGHSFFERWSDDFADECADAWDRILAFVR